MINLKENDIILFQGDSITDGNRGRTPDPNHILGHGYQYILAGEMLYCNPGKNIEIINRGISGNKIHDLSQRWQKDCIDLKPSILSVLIGINDILFNHNDKSGASPEEFQNEYINLIKRIKQSVPECSVVIMEPFYGKATDENTDKFFRSQIPFYREAARKVAKSESCLFVPLQDVFDEFAKSKDIYDVIWDGIHPTTLGHYMIAQRWKQIVFTELNKR